MNICLRASRPPPHKNLPLSVFAQLADDFFYQCIWIAFVPGHFLGVFRKPSIAEKSFRLLQHRIAQHLQQTSLQIVDTALESEVLKRSIHNWQERLLEML